MNIKGLDKAAVLAALFNASRQQGLGFLDNRGAQPMSKEDAANIIKADGLDFDYLYGRVMKIDLEGNDICTYGYDRDNGQGAAERAIAPLRAVSVEASRG